MTHIHVAAHGRATPRQPVAVVWSAVDTVPALTSLITMVSQCDAIDGGWRWDLGQRGALGLHVHVTFDVAMTHEEATDITFTPIGDAAAWASGGGRITLVDQGETTEVVMDINLDLELSVPRLLGPGISKVVHREVQSAVDDFLRRWVAQVGG